MSILLSTVAQAIGAQLPVGCADRPIEAITSLGGADEHSVSFVMGDKNNLAAEQSCAAALIVARGKAIAGKLCLEVDDPYVGYAVVGQLFEQRAPLFGPGIHPRAIVDATAQIHDSVAIGPGCVIGAHCSIGADTIIDANCVIEPFATIGSGCRIYSGAVLCREVQLGDGVIIQSNAVIGSEGFANARAGERFIRIPSFGTVIIEDGAEIGAGVTIDRGNFEPTRIGKGVKIDNLVQIAHNCSVGQNSAIAAQTGMAGSTTVGEAVLIAGQVGFAGHMHIGDRSFVGAKAGVSKSVEPGSKITGYPARDFMTMRRIEAAQMKLPELLKELKELRRRVDGLESTKS
jgi:UDP-3-O-[3-hydroxymyristoyl] glucosamine N-acyltransferase